MDLMRVEEALRGAGRYETPADLRRPLAGRLFGWSDAWFYSRVADVVYSGYRIARRGAYDMRAWQEQSFTILNAVESSGGRVTIENAQPVLRHPGPKVFAANHMSMLETLLLPGILLSLGPVTVVLKESLARYPYFGHIVGAIHAITVTRRNARDDLKAVLTQGQAALERGTSVLIFPQATRSLTFDPSLFNSLAVKLARRTGAPVVPLALKTDFMGVGRFVRDFGRLDRRQPIHFRFGEPLETGSGAIDVHEETIRFISCTLREWQCPVMEPGGRKADA